MANRILEIIDKETGEIERIHESDGNFHASLAYGAHRAGLTYADAVSLLDGGAEIETAGFVRRFAKDSQQAIPELLAACEAMLDAISDLGDDARAELHEGCVEALIAAISKVKGGAA